MKPLFTIHEGEFLVGDYINRKLGRKFDVWVPTKDTGVDLLEAAYEWQSDPVGQLRHPHQASGRQGIRDRCVTEAAGSPALPVSCDRPYLTRGRRWTCSTRLRSNTYS